MAHITSHPLDDYLWREYEWICPISGVAIIYRVDAPCVLYTAENGTTHRVEDRQGVVHIVPAVGYFGCRVRYAKAEHARKVTF